MPQKPFFYFLFKIKIDLRQKPTIYYSHVNHYLRIMYEIATNPCSTLQPLNCVTRLRFLDIIVKHQQKNNLLDAYNSLENLPLFSTEPGSVCIFWFRKQVPQFVGKWKRLKIALFVVFCLVDYCDNSIIQWVCVVYKMLRYPHVMNTFLKIVFAIYCVMHSQFKSFVDVWLNVWNACQKSMHQISIEITKCSSFSWVIASSIFLRLLSFPIVVSLLAIS